MSINIKDPEVHRLARQLARETGKSMTRVVRESLEARCEALEQSRRRATVDELLTIARKVSEAVDGEVPDHGKMLYDEQGLPE